MKKGLDKIHSALRFTDAVLEVHDARIPFSGRHPDLKNILQLRPHLLVLNKRDLADLDLNRQTLVKQQLNSEGIDNVLYMRLSSEKILPVIRKKLVPMMMEEIEKKPRYRKSLANEYNIMVIGVPNVGKSTLLNKLRESYTGLRKGAQTGQKPGITKAVMNKMRVSHDPEMFVIDTPGILNPKVKDVHTGMRLALCDCIPSHLVGVEDIADYLLFWLNTHENFSYLDLYNIKQPTDDILEFLSYVAAHKRITIKARSRVYMTDQDQVPKYRLDLHGAAESVIRDFRLGLFGKVLLDDDLLKEN